MNNDYKSSSVQSVKRGELSFHATGPWSAWNYFFFSPRCRCSSTVAIATCRWWRHGIHLRRQRYVTLWPICRLRNHNSIVGLSVVLVKITVWNALLTLQWQKKHPTAIAHVRTCENFNLYSGFYDLPVSCGRSMHWPCRELVLCVMHVKWLLSEIRHCCESVRCAPDTTAATE